MRMLLGDDQRAFLRFASEYELFGRDEIPFKLVGASAPGGGSGPASETLAVDFTNRTDRSGGLVAPKFNADGISRTKGLVNIEGARSLDPSKLFAEGASLLGFDLRELVENIQSPPEVVTVLRDGQPPEVRMTWKKVKLRKFPTDDPTFIPVSNSTLTLTVVSSATVNETTCEIGKFTLAMPTGSSPLLKITFDHVNFTQQSGKPPTLELGPLSAELDGKLKLLQVLQEKVGLGRASPKIEVTPNDIVARFAIPVPDVAAFSFVMSNLVFHAAVRVPFRREPVSVELNGGVYDHEPARIKYVRAFVVRGGGADYHDQGEGHWIDDHIATPMSKYPGLPLQPAKFRPQRARHPRGRDRGDDGTIGFSVTTGGELGCWIIEKHLARFIEGARVTDIEKIWDQMFNATLYYGRKGIVINTISGVDLALWDLLAKVRKEPVHALLGGPVRDELTFYATGARPDLAKQMGFIGGKLPLHHGPAEREEGLKKNLDLLGNMRSKVGDDFWLMYDCWMSLDVEYATRLARAAREEYGLKWIEEALPPDDYWGYAELRRNVPRGLLVTTGEHEATRWGFRMLLEMECCDILQPDVGWCGGITELLKISALADAHGKLVVPHGSSVYSYHFVITRHNSPFAEFLMMAPEADTVVPMFSPQLLDEPVPVNGRMKASALDAPGFGVRLNPECKLHRPYPR